jgi:phosphoglycerate dehydrogenase-like enzyme
MKPKSIINTCRSEVVDEAALTPPQHGRSWAGLDTFAKEPTDQPIRSSSPQRDLSPHSAGPTELRKRFRTATPTSSAWPPAAPVGHPE